jgi:hypothetical protein
MEKIDQFIPSSIKLHSAIKPMLADLQRQMNRSVDVLVIKAVQEYHKQFFKGQYGHNKEEVQTLR